MVEETTIQQVKPDDLRRDVKTLLDQYIEELEHPGEKISLDDFVSYLVALQQLQTTGRTLTPLEAAMTLALNSLEDIPDALGARRCVQAPVGCGKSITGFRDQLSVREYIQSGLCQACQDDFFVEGRSEDTESDLL